MQSKHNYAQALLLLLLSLHRSAASMFFQEKSKTYVEGERVPLMVNKMTSTKALFPIDYYSLPFCAPVDGPSMPDREDLGQILDGDKIETSPYELYFKKDVYCQRLCISNLGRGEISGIHNNKVALAIWNEYHNNWLVDNLPSASKTETDDYIITRYTYGGFPLGFIHATKRRAYIYNHVNIEIRYAKTEGGSGGYNILGFVVEPFSIMHDFEMSIIMNPIESCIAGVQKHTDYDMVTAEDRYPQWASGEVLFTYDVIWIEGNDPHYPSRWTAYARGMPPLLVSLQIGKQIFHVLVLLAVLVAVVRRMRMPQEHWQGSGVEDGNEADVEQQPGWKALHGDVFRPPLTSPMLLCVLVGTGAQLLVTVFVTALLSFSGLIGFKSHGTLVTPLIVIFALSGCMGGYVSAQLYKSLNGPSTSQNTLWTALLFPCAALGVTYLVSVLATGIGSTYAFTPGAFALMFLAGITSAMMSIAGSHLGNIQEAIDFPAKPSRTVSLPLTAATAAATPEHDSALIEEAIDLMAEESSGPRQIPTQPCWRWSLIRVPLCGFALHRSFMPMTKLLFFDFWKENNTFAAYGFFLLTYTLLLVETAEIAILVNARQLQNEDYRWWWRAFANTGGGLALWIAGFSAVRFDELEITGRSPSVFFWSYMLMVCFAILLVHGFVGVFACLWFNKWLYSRAHFDYR